MRNLKTMSAPTAHVVLALLMACSDGVSSAGSVDPAEADDAGSETREKHLDGSMARVATVRDAGSSESHTPTHDAEADSSPSSNPHDPLNQQDGGAGPMPGHDEGSTGSGLPCNVETLLTQRCRSCHGAKPVGGAPMALVTYAELTAPTPSDQSKTNAQSSLEEMQAGTMPPGGGVSAGDLQGFAAWVQSGAPKTSCGGAATGKDAGLVTDAGVVVDASVVVDAGGGVSDPYDTKSVCTSRHTWTNGDRGSDMMHPGDACISCHSRGRGPSFALAGTLYPTAHEPNDCNGSSASGASIVITDAKGATHTLMPNAAGNFYWSGSLAKPYTAKLVYQGRSREMSSGQTNGDCNSCHTESGLSGAPGRLMLP